MEGAVVNTQAEEARMPAVAVRTQGAVARIRVGVPGRVAARRLVWRNNNGFCTSTNTNHPKPVPSLPTITLSWHVL